MALQMIHMCALRMDDSIQVLWSHSHLDRDEDYEMYLSLWEGPPGEAPILKHDFLLDGSWTHRDIEAWFRRMLNRATVKTLLEDALAGVGVMIIGAVRVRAEDDEPPPSVH